MAATNNSKVLRQIVILSALNTRIFVPVTNRVKMYINEESYRILIRVPI